MLYTGQYAQEEAMPWALVSIGLDRFAILCACIHLFTGPLLYSFLWLNWLGFKQYSYHAQWHRIIFLIHFFVVSFMPEDKSAHFPFWSVPLFQLLFLVL